MRPTSRRAFTIVELLVVQALAVLILTVAVAGLVSSGRGQKSTGDRADALEEAARAHVRLARDLGSFQADRARAVPLVTGTVGQDLSVQVPVARSDGSAVEVRWAFAATSGTLTRTEGTDLEERFELGPGGAFDAVFIDPPFAFQAGGVLGNYANRMVYTISVRPPAGGRTRMALVAATPLTTKAANDTFPFSPEVP